MCPAGGKIVVIDTVTQNRLNGIDKITKFDVNFSVGSRVLRPMSHHWGVTS